MAEENDLISRARRGDAEAWRALYGAHAPVVRRVCAAFASLSSADLEDAVQESFVRAFKSLDQLQSDDRFGAWVLAIARSVCLGRLRKRRSDRDKIDRWAGDPTMGPRAPRSDVDMMRAQRIALVREMIEALPDGAERDTVQLFYVEGKMSAREIAEHLGTKKSTVTMRLERFRAKVKRRLAAKLARLEEVGA